MGEIDSLPELPSSSLPVHLQQSLKATEPRGLGPSSQRRRSTWSVIVALIPFRGHKEEDIV